MGALIDIAGTARPPAEDRSTRERLKAEAQRLIAEFGVDGVSTRDIVRAAGQKNVASLHYYFGTKERLLEELVADAAVLMEGRRAVALEALIGSRGAISVRDLVKVLVIGSAVQGEPDERMRSVSRFVTALFPKYRSIFENAIGDRLNITFQRCLGMIRERAPGVPPEILNTRLLFLSLSLMELFAAREAAMEAASPTARAYWGNPTMVDTIVDAMTGMILGPVHGCPFSVGGGRRWPEGPDEGSLSD